MVVVVLGVAKCRWERGFEEVCYELRVEVFLGFGYENLVKILFVF